MRYFVAFVACVILSFATVIILLASIIPPGEGSFGIAKMVPIILIVVPPALFALLWFPTNLVVFWLHRRKQKTPTPPVLWVSAGAMLLSLAVVGVQLNRWVPAWRSDRREKKFELISSRPNIQLNDVKGLIDRYAVESKRGTQPQPPSGKYAAIRIVIANPATPPDVLEYLANKMDDGSPVLFFIAENSNCPPTLITRFSSIPAVLPYLASNPQAPPDLLESLAHSSDWQVRDSVAKNPEAPRRIIDLLTNDPKWTVQDSARRSIKLRFGRQAVR